MPTRSIVFDAASSAVTTAALGDNELLWNHTVGTADTERALFVCIAMRTTLVSVTGVTFNGVAMSSIGADNTGNAKVSWYALANPTPGTHQIDAQFDNGTHAVGSAVSYYGVDQGQPTSTGTANAGSGTTAAMDALSIGDDVVIAGFCKVDNTEAVTIGLGTERVQNVSTGGSASINCYGMIADITGVLGFMDDAVTYTWPTSSRDWTCYSLAIKPATFITGQASILFNSASSSNTGSAGTTTLSWSHALSAGTKRVGFLSISEFTNSTLSATFPQYDGNTMTLVNEANVTSGMGAALYYYVIPDVDSGSKTISLQWTGSGRRCADFVVYGGCNTSSPIGDDTTGNGSGFGGSVAVTTTVGQVVTDCFAKRDSSEGASPGPGQAQLEFDATTNATASNNCLIYTSAREANDGSTTMQWGYAVARQWVLIAVAVNPDTYVPKISNELLGLSPLSPISGVH